jgi:hypothetical protein
LNEDKGNLIAFPISFAVGPARRTFLTAVAMGVGGRHGRQDFFNGSTEHKQIFLDHPSLLLWEWC